MNNQEKIIHQKNHFNSISEKYYKARQDSNHLCYKKLIFNQMLSELKEYYGKEKRICVLEPMCGYAEGFSIVKEYISENFDYEGFDYSDSLVEMVREANSELQVYLQDVTTFKATKKYDLIILIGGLHHVPDYIESVVKEMYLALSENGLFINFEPTHNNILVKWIREKIYKKNALFDEQTEHDFSLKELNDIYNEAGFTVFKQYYPGLLAYILFYNPDAFPLLNIGKERFVKFMWKLEKRLITNIFGRKMSFATFSILKRN